MSASKHANTQFPAPTGTYKVALKNNRNWRDAPEVRLQISVGKPGTEGDKFFALCEWATARFPKSVLVVSDTLQRHNLMFEHGLSEDEARQRSLKYGDEWIARNKESIEVLNNVEILRWETTLENPKTEPMRLKLLQLYAQDSDFRAAIDGTISGFWHRNTDADNASSQLRKGWFEQHSRNFLLEELAVFSWLCQRPGVDAYAGSWMEKAYGALARHPGSEFRAFEKDWIQIDYTRNKSLSAVRQPAIAA